jgi:hypothetical protein
VKKEVKKAAKGAEEPEESNVNNWTDEEQELLNQGLAENPASMDKKERWKKQAEESARRALAEQVGEAANAAAAAAYEAALAAAQAELADAGDEVDDMLAASGKSGAGGAVSRADDGRAADRLVEAGIVTTFSQDKDKKQHRNAKDIVRTTSRVFSRSVGRSVSQSVSQSVS